LFNYLIT